MASLVSILGGPWTPPIDVKAPPECQLIEAMKSAGLEPPDQIHMDGRIHRFRSGTKGSGGKGGDKPGWYVVFPDGVPAGRFGCWRAGVESAWRADIGRPLTAAEDMAHAQRMAEAKAARDAELAKQHEIAADVVAKIWTTSQPASPEHPYLARKGIQPHGARVTGDGRLVVPLYSADGELQSLQYIAHDGGKLYHAGGQTGGNFWMIGTTDQPGEIYIAEGFATAATIHQVTGRPCVVAYSASNLVPVTGAIREHFGVGQTLIIVADNDKSGTGQKYADQASAKHGARVVMPPEEGMDANDYAQAGGDLLALLKPQDAGVWLIPADDFCKQPAPIRWLVKGWLQAEALIMVHGPSGGGKTFAVLDWVLRIAAGGGEWHGKPVKGGGVVYLAGEGHHGLRGRIAAWKLHNKVNELEMWLSKEGCDLNTTEGYQRVVEHIRSLPTPPRCIVVDTLHRFLFGDENSAQDAKTMLDACARLIAEFGCSVVLVHHTGNNDEAKHRARGSSAWRAALDNEISIIPGTCDGEPIQIVQRKCKDAEMSAPEYMVLQSVMLPGWIDEDGEQVGSAVAVQADAPAQIEAKKPSKLDEFRKTFENAWFASGAESLDGAPYLTRSALSAKLAADRYAERTIENMLKPSETNKLIGALMLAEIITPKHDGWVVSEPIQASAMMMRAGEKKAGDYK